MQVLLKLFPFSAWDKESISPLTPMQATEFILVPETAISLIAEDMEESYDEAIATMRRSSRYGSLIFPSHDSDDDGLEDDIVRERAAIRRRQVVIEDRVEKKVLKSEGLWKDDEEMDGVEKEDGKRLYTTSRPKPTPRPRRSI